MGIFSDYIKMNLTADEIFIERKRWLQNISALRQRPIIVYASDMSREDALGIDFSDIHPFADQLSNVGDDEAIDIILETPGGYAEVVEDLVRMVRERFDQVGIIVPGTAKSAGTIFAMAADEILMCPASSLGPIDAQIFSRGRFYSADAFLKGIQKIVQGPVGYAAILQSISPGEIQHCENAQNFSKVLVTKWLKEYKFKNWKVHSSDNREVTENDRENRAREIAENLSNQDMWLTHSRSIKIKDLENMRLMITDYSKNSELYNAITRYHTLLRLSFESTGMVKLVETLYTQINCTRREVK